jgi:iron complex outermembrane receptor protein
MKLRNYILGTSLTALGLGFTISALAQGIEEVIVTAQKREESSQDIPIAIDVISGDTFIQEGIRDIKDIGKTSTELEINSNNGQATRIGMRGLQQNGFAPTGDTMAAAHLDGIFLGSFWSLNGLMFDLERVEVLAGPQGTLYGRNSAAGAINLISRRPGKEFAADGNIEFGSFSTQRINAGISAPLTDTFAVRLAGTKYKRDAVYTDGGGAVDQWAGRLSAVWDVTDNDQLQFTYDYIKTGGTNEAGGLLRVEAVNDYTTTWNGTTSVGAFSATPPASVTQVAGLVGDPYNNTAYETARGLVFDGNLSSTHWGAMLNYTHDFGGFDMVAQYSHRDLEAIAWVATRGATAAFNQVYPQTAESDVGELRFVSDDQGAITWVGGLFWYRTSIVHGNAIPNSFSLAPLTLPGGRQVPIAGNPIDPNTLLDLPGCPCSSGFSPVNGDTDAYAAYGQMTWTPDSMQNWHFTAGLRYSYDKKSTVQGYFVNSTLYSLWVPGNNIPAFLQPSIVLPSEATAANVATTIRTDGEDTWGSFQYRLGLEYDVSDTSLLYGSISTGYKSGGFAYGSTPRLEPETLLAYEVGTKNRFLDNTVQFNASAWFYDYKNIEFGISRALQPPFPLVNNNPLTGIGSVGNVGKVQLGGVAFDLDWAPNTSDRIGLAGTHIYSKVVDGYETLDGVRRQVLNEGERFGDSPRWQWIGRYSHAFEFAGGSSLTPLVKYQYQTSKYDGAQIPAGSVAEGVTTIDPSRGTYNLERQNPGQTIVPAQGIMDFQLTYKAASGAWDVTAYVHNVFDELDIKNIGYTNNPGVAAATAGVPRRTVAANSSYGHVTAALGEPRTVGVILSARFK